MGEATFDLDLLRWEDNTFDLGHTFLLAANTEDMKEGSPSLILPLAGKSVLSWHQSLLL